MSTKSKQNKAGSTVARVLRPRQPKVPWQPKVPRQPEEPEPLRQPKLPEEQLKAERVQLTAEDFSERLKAERVQLRLQAMPGWRLALGGEALDRLRQFPSPRVAADFAGYLTQLAAHVRQPVTVDLCGKRVAITLRAREGSGLTEAALDFAQALG